MRGEWLRKPASAACVVFVHGILSDGERCWLNSNGSFWPGLLAEEPELSTLGVYVFTYQTGVFSGEYRIGDIVDALRVHFRLDGVLANDTIIFVCHSMGGIAVRQYLLDQQVEFMRSRKRIGLFLVASPSLGSRFADLLSPIAQLFGNAQANELRFIQNNAFLDDLERRFRNLKESKYIDLEGQELVEDKFIFLSKVLRRPVVERFAGQVWFGEGYKVPGSDHFSIAKPESRDSVQHRLLCEFVNSRLSKAGTQSSSLALKIVNPKIEAYHYAPDQAGLKFSVTNFSAHTLQLCRLALTVMDRKQVRAFRLATVGAPIPEFRLKADITEKDSVDLLEGCNHQFILNPNTSDAFSVEVTGRQGTRYHASVQCTAESVEAKTVWNAEDACEFMFPISRIAGAK